VNEVKDLRIHLEKIFRCLQDDIFSPMFNERLRELCAKTRALKAPSE
jgi:hypothetical protein